MNSIQYISNSCSNEYRFGFNGKENDNEVKGVGNQQDYGFRIYDPRIGKFLSVDPLFKKYPELTTYQFASNRPIDAIDIDGLEAWLIKNQWSTENIAQFRSQLSNKINQYQKEGKIFTCDDLGLECAISFAKENKLPFKWTTGSGTFDASSKKYSDYNTFLNDVKSHSGAPDFANNQNTTKIDAQDIKPGSLAVLKHNGKTQPNHVQLITNLFQDEGVTKGYNAAQGNFNNLGRIFGSDNPESARYLGVPVQKGYYSFEVNTWSNHTEGTTTSNFYGGNYSGEYRDFNFSNMNNSNTQSNVTIPYAPGYTPSGN